MNAKQHLNFYLYSGSLLIAGFGIAQLDLDIDKNDLMLLVVGGGVGALLPDVDHRNGTLSMILPFYLMHDALKGFTRIFRHGGITHTILINTWIYIIAYYMESMLIAGFGVGYMTHLYADHITGNKLNMLWWPLGKGFIFQKQKRRCGKNDNRRIKKKC